MTTNPHTPDTFTLIAQVEETYASLMHFASVRDQANLGGSLLYAGELAAPGRTLAIAANIAGAATLTASDHPESLRHAQRDGVVDFLVNSLDEALRILKNEIRKREPVAVAVSIPPDAIVQQMLDRGVLPDLLPPFPQSSAAESELSNPLAPFIQQGARRIQAPPSRPNSKLLVWPIPAEYAQRPSAFEALLLQHLQPEDHFTRRWLRLSPRYLGPQARRLRSLSCDPETASTLIERLGPPFQP